MTIESEFIMLEEWFYWWCEDYTSQIKNFHPTQVIRRLKEEGIMYVSHNSEPMTFEQFKETFI